VSEREQEREEKRREREREGREKGERREREGIELERRESVRVKEYKIIS